MRSRCFCVLPAIAIQFLSFGCVRKIEREKVVSLEEHSVQEMGVEKVLAHASIVGVCFCDYHRGEDIETVEVKGQELVLNGNLGPLFKRLSELKPSRVIVGIEKKPHPKIATRIWELQAFCETEGIEIDTSADELYFILGGQLQMPASKDVKYNYQIW